MKKNIIKLSLLFLIAIFVLTGCTQSVEKKNEANSKIKIMVSILPLIEFVEKVGGDKVEVEAVIPPGYEPHSYELTADTLTKISKANLYVQAGQVEFEKSNMDKIEEQNKDMKIIDGSEGIVLRNLEKHTNDEENEDEEENHSKEEKDPHTWLSVENAKIYVENIYQALIELDSDNREYYLNNKESYLGELDELGEYLQKNLSQVENKKMIVYHPAFGYLLDEYGFEQIPIEIEGKEPTASQLEELVKEAEEENIKIIFVEKQFSEKNAEALASEIGGSVIQIDPLAQNFVENLRNIGKIIEENL